jgi:hypothetical protein
MTAALDLRERVLAAVQERGPVSGNALARALRRRREDVSAALAALEYAGRLRRTRGGWEAVGNGRETAETPPSGLTAAALDRMTRPKRVEALWSEMSPAGRERAWAALDGNRRADAIALLFDAVEIREPETAAGAFHRWQTGADR